MEATFFGKQSKSNSRRNETCVPQQTRFSGVNRKMFDVALASGGAQIALSTSSDDNHPPEHLIDG